MSGMPVSDFNLQNSFSNVNLSQSSLQAIQTVLGRVKQQPSLANPLSLLFMKTVKDGSVQFEVKQSGIFGVFQRLTSKGKGTSDAQQIATHIATLVQQMKLFSLYSPGQTHPQLAVLQQLQESVTLFNEQQKIALHKKLNEEFDDLGAVAKSIFKRSGLITEAGLYSNDQLKAIFDSELGFPQNLEDLLSLKRNLNQPQFKHNSLAQGLLQVIGHG